MHELGIAMEIISIVEREIEDRGLNGIEIVKLQVGALSGVDPEALSFGFEVASTNTRLAGAKLDIEWLDVKARCRVCGQCFDIDDLAFMCPNCDSRNIEIMQGEELDIAQLVAT